MAGRDTTGPQASEASGAKEHSMNKTNPSFRNAAVHSLAGLLLVSFASACASGPMTSRETGAATGAVIGAGSGAIIGSRSGDTAEGALIGGAIGAIAGGVLGDQHGARKQQDAEIQRRVDQQEAELARNRELIEELKRSNLDARASDRGVVVNLPDVLFEFGSADLTGEARYKIADMANILGGAQAVSRRLSVEGHTDSIGSIAYNQSLSERRARSVADALAGFGVARSRLAVRGFGKSAPAAPNVYPDGRDNPEGRARNRRVEVVILD